MKVKDSDFAYAVAYIRANERHLLGSADIQALVGAEKYEDAFELLCSKGFVKNGETDISKAIALQEKQLWDLLLQSVPDKNLLSVFTVENDFYNIKAAVKCSFEQKSPEPFFKNPTSLDLNQLKDCAEKHDFDLLDSQLSESAKKAYQTAVTTQNGQSADIILDSAALAYMQNAADESGCELVKKINEFLCLCANLKIAVRCARTKKEQSFTRTALCMKEQKDNSLLASLCADGEQNVIDFFKGTAVETGAALIENDTAAFEKWVDDSIMQMIKEAKYVFFGFEPICAYYYAKLAEIKTVRLVMGAKQSGLSEETILKRVRELYV